MGQKYLRRQGPSRETFAGGAYGIPHLLPDRIPTEFPSEVCTVGYHPIARHAIKGKCLCCYVDDYRFAGCWSRPHQYATRLIDAHVASVVMPDFSLYADLPLAEQIHAAYRSHWVARYWQSHGLAVIPSLNWSDAASLEWSLAGIPYGSPLVAIESRASAVVRDGWLHCCETAIYLVRPQKILWYGVDPGISRVESRVYRAWSPRQRQPKSDCDSDRTRSSDP